MFYFLYTVATDVLETFISSLQKSNGEPFANADAAFTLGYAIIMLNVDQHNHNVKKQNIPMTVEVTYTFLQYSVVHVTP